MLYRKLDRILCNSNLIKRVKFGNHVVKRLALETHGITCSDIQPLVAYEDRNFLIRDAFSEREYVYKLKKECNKTPTLDIVKRVQTHLHLSSFKVAHPLQTIHGKSSITKQLEVEAGKLDKWCIELFPFIPGKTIFESNISSENLREIARDVGYFGGLVDKHIMRHSEKITKHELKTTPVEYNKWSTSNFYAMKKYVHLVKDKELNRVMVECLEEFKKRITPVLHQLRHGFIHGDLSDTNIILTEESFFSDNEVVLPIKERFGLIDFEDGHYGAVVFDLTVLLAYMMAYAEGIETDAIEIGKRVFSGYQDAFPLTEKEKSVIFLGIMARLVTSCVMSLEYISKDPENEEYLSGQASKCPSLIKSLWEIGYEAFTKEVVADGSIS